MSSYKSHLHKYVVYKFLRMSISVEKNDLTTASLEGLEKPKAVDERCIEKLSKKRMSGRKSRKCKFSGLAGCGCTSGRSSVIIGRDTANSRMQEVCSAQSLPICSSMESKVEKCPDWIPSASFDEMIKMSSNFGSQDGLEFHYTHKSSSPEVHISPVKFNELVNSFRKSKEISTSAILSADNEKALDANFQSVTNPTKFNYSHRPSRRTINEPRLAGKVVQSNVEKSMMLHSRRKDTLMESLLIMKSSCNPQREFKDSMMEMIYENEIKDGKEMEALLACYLFLNSAEYHDLIIQVFKQVWTDLVCKHRIKS